MDRPILRVPNLLKIAPVPQPVCGLCNLDASVIIARERTAVVVLPNAPHIATSDGGHLLVATVRHVANRAGYTGAEADALHRLTVIAARTLLDLGWADWINFQENGNWSVDARHGPHSHTHVYGRSRTSIEQPFGEPLRLPTSAELNAKPIDRPSASEIAKLKSAIAVYS